MGSNGARVLCCFDFSLSLALVYSTWLTVSAAVHSHRCAQTASATTSNRRCSCRRKRQREASHTSKPSRPIRPSSTTPRAADTADAEMRASETDRIHPGHQPAMHRAAPPRWAHHPNAHSSRMGLQRTARHSQGRVSVGVIVRRARQHHEMHQSRVLMIVSCRCVHVLDMAIRLLAAGDGRRCAGNLPNGLTRRCTIVSNTHISERCMVRTSPRRCADNARRRA
jgi:hypothetical protein